MSLGLEVLSGSLSFVGIALLGLFWKYSALPEIDWRYIVAGAMFLFTGWAVNIFGNALGTWVAAEWISWLVAIANLLGALLVVVGALLNAFSHLGKK